MYLLLRGADDRKPVVGGGQDEDWGARLPPPPRGWLSCSIAGASPFCRLSSGPSLLMTEGWGLCCCFS